MDPLTLVQTAISLAVQAKALIDRVKKQDEDVMDLRLRLNRIESFLREAISSNRSALVAEVATDLVTIAGNEQHGLVKFLTSYEKNLARQNSFSLRAVFGFATQVANGSRVEEQLRRYDERLRTVQGYLDTALQIEIRNLILQQLSPSPAALSPGAAVNVGQPVISIAQPVSASNSVSFIANNESIHVAVKLWFRNRAQAEAQYGQISTWNTHSVTNMRELFRGCETFNEDISTWDVSNVTDMYRMFNGASSFNSDLSQWNVSKVTFTVGMFFNASSFNSDLSQWNVSKVTNMGSMFLGASSFNSDVSQWSVSEVTYMGYMFDGASSFAYKEQCKQRWSLAGRSPGW